MKPSQIDHIYEVMPKTSHRSTMVDIFFAAAVRFWWYFFDFSDVVKDEQTCEQALLAESRWSYFFFCKSSLSYIPYFFLYLIIYI